LVQLLDKFPNSIGPFQIKASFTENSSTPSTTQQHNYSDLQELSLSESQPNKEQRGKKLGQWQQLAILVDKLFFILWIIILFIFDVSSFPSYDIQF
jgi:hypothetical protein